VWRMVVDGSIGLGEWIGRVVDGFDRVYEWVRSGV
jgi:hypothetical protein